MRSERARSEDDLEARFDSLVRTHRARALSLAWRLVGGDSAAAEDVVQDALVNAYRGLPRFRGGAQLETWFYRIVVRTAYSHLRWRRVRDRFGRVDPEAAADTSPAPQGDPVLRRRIVSALESLPRNQRDAFILVHMEGFTVREAAEIMGKAVGTVKSHLQRALERLRTRLAGTLATNSPAPAADSPAAGSAPRSAEIRPGESGIRAEARAESGFETGSDTGSDKRRD